MPENKESKRERRPVLVEANVLQRPYAVQFCCPKCDHEFTFDYRKFCDDFDDPPDWNGKIINCPECRAELTIDGQSWD